MQLHTTGSVKAPGIGRDLNWWWLMNVWRCVMACRVGWMPLLAGRDSEFRSGNQSSVAGMCRVVRGSGTGAGLGSGEELVHDLGAFGDHRSQFAAVDDLGGAGGGVPDEAGDLLDA